MYVLVFVFTTACNWKTFDQKRLYKVVLKGYQFF